MTFTRCFSVLLCVLNIGLYGCASSDHIRTQTNRFDLPESIGKSHYRLNVESAGANEIQFTGNLISPPDIDQPKLEAAHGQRGVRLGLGIVDNLELQVESLPYLSDSLKGVPAIKAKYQFLGAPLKSAQKNNLSLAASAGLVYLERTLITTGNPSYHNDINLLVMDFAGIAGYRFTDTLMVYGGPFVNLLYFDGQWKRKSFGVADGLDEKYSGSGNQFGANLGLAWFANSDWSLLAELAYTDLTWNDSQDDFTHFGVQLSRLID